MIQITICQMNFNQIFFKDAKRSTDIMINISSCLALRVEVVLVDPSRENPNYMGNWHVFLPSDVSLVCLLSYQMQL